jgi:hypothetical protein
VPLLQAPQQIHDLRPYTYIEGRDRLIEHQQLGPERQSAGNVDALALPAGELVGKAAQGRLVEADLFEKRDSFDAQ